LTTVACVLREGGDFTPEHVFALEQQVRAYLPVDVHFVCLTDSEDIHDEYSQLDEQTRSIALRYDTPGWWAKLELFRNDVFPAGEHIIYFDLDTIIVQDVPNLTTFNRQFATSRGPRFGNLASGVMTWFHGTVLDTLLPVYLDDPYNMRQFYDGLRHAASGGRRGDQGLIADRCDAENLNWEAVEDVQSGIIRYARDERLKEGPPPDDVRVIVFSGGRNRPEKVRPDLFYSWIL